MGRIYFALKMLYFGNTLVPARFPGHINAFFNSQSLVRFPTSQHIAVFGVL